MKNVKNDIFLNIFLLFIGVLFFLLFFSYFLLREHTLDTISINDLNIIFLEISGVCFILIGLVYFVLKKIQKNVQEDIEEVTQYLHEISQNKNYDAVIKIKNYLEFLTISLVLKNIVKRLNQKERKTLKK